MVALGTGPNLGTAQEGALKICEFAWVFGACEELEDFAHGRFREADGKIPLLLLALMKTFRKRCWIFWRAVRSPARYRDFYPESSAGGSKIGGPGHFDAGSRGGVPDAVSLCVSSMVFGIPFRSRQGKLVGERRFG